MSERLAFLESIRSNPADDVSRLVYADWLDENGDRGDLDRATSEFIRLSCDRSGAKRMPDAAYAWIEDNWMRLIPSALAVAVSGDELWQTPSANTTEVRKFGPLSEVYRVGRVIFAHIGIDLSSDPAAVAGHRYSMRFNFHRGFLSRWHVWSPHAERALAPLLDRDQPFYEVAKTNLRVAST